MSDDLDELNGLLYYGLEPQRQRHHEAMIAALQCVAPASLTFSRWTRLVTWRYSTDPLSAAGSLAEYGGRFNIGRDVDKTMRAPWPSLYLGENFETAYREKNFNSTVAIESMVSRRKNWPCIQETVLPPYA